MRNACWPIRISNSSQWGSSWRSSQCRSSRSGMEWWQRSSRRNISNLDANNVLYMMNLIRSPSYHKNFLIWIGWRIPTQLHMSASFSRDLEYFLKYSLTKKYNLFNCITTFSNNQTSFIRRNMHIESFLLLATTSATSNKIGN